MSNSPNPRENLTPGQRALELKHTIDPGFVNRRAAQTVLQESGMKIIDDMIRSLPPDLPEGLREVRIDHIYNKILLTVCELNGIYTLGQNLAKGNGHLFCSTEKVLPCPNVYDDARAVSYIQPAGESQFQVRLEYSTSHIRSDTLRMELHNGADLSIIAIYSRTDGNCLVFRPLVMGNPWLLTDDSKLENHVMFWGREFFENFIEDFDEFSRVREFPKPGSFEIMERVPERGFKRALAKILGDNITKDWGGEQSDHFTSNIHLGGRRATASFLLKGPARFAPMSLNHLGKNNDQIYRLSQEPSDILFVQHSHDITPPVRATLRAFTVQPGRPRRYCLIDGRDSLWLLNAYGLLDEALAG